MHSSNWHPCKTRARLDLGHQPAQRSHPSCRERLYLCKRLGPIRTVRRSDSVNVVNDEYWSLIIAKAGKSVTRYPARDMQEAAMFEATWQLPPTKCLCEVAMFQ